MVNVGLKRVIASSYLEPEKIVVLYFRSQLQLLLWSYNESIKNQFSFSGFSYFYN